MHSEASGHPETCYGCKIRSISWGVVPGGFTAQNSSTYFDRDSLKESGIDLSKEEVEDHRSDYRRMIASADRETASYSGKMP